MWFFGCRTRSGLAMLAYIFLSGFHAKNLYAAAEFSGPLPEPHQPYIGVIIDDLGVNYQRGLRTVQLPGPVACAFLPDARHASELAQKAHANYKEVMLHLPMEPMDASVGVDPGALTSSMSHQEFILMIREGLAKVPHVTGVNNHMGSLITRHAGHMAWLMQELGNHGDLFFIDSRTDKRTVAYATAQAYGLPSLSRDVFLDNKATAAEVAFQFDRLLQLAKKNGYAIAIGHPYDVTLTLLEKRLAKLDQEGVQLAPISVILEFADKRNGRWQASLSPSHKAVKN